MPKSTLPRAGAAGAARCPTGAAPRAAIGARRPRGRVAQRAAGRGARAATRAPLRGRSSLQKWRPSRRLVAALPTSPNEATRAGSRRRRRARMSRRQESAQRPPTGGRACVDAQRLACEDLPTGPRRSPARDRRGRGTVLVSFCRRRRALLLGLLAPQPRFVPAALADGLECRERLEEGAEVAMGGGDGLGDGMAVVVGDVSNTRRGSPSARSARSSRAG